MGITGRGFFCYRPLNHSLCKKNKTLLQIWDSLLISLPSWQVGGHWETAAAQETQVSAVHRIQVTKSLLLSFLGQKIALVTWQNSLG